MVRIICVASVKGGVGKTTTVANLATIFSDLGYKVLAVDANVTGSNLGLHFGTSSVNSLTIQDVLKGIVKVDEAINKDNFSFHLLSGGIYLNDSNNVDIKLLNNTLESVKKNYDIILVDCAAGLNDEAKSAISASDEVLIVTTPELPAVAGAYKLVEYAENNWIPVSGVVINKEENHKYKDITVKDVEEILGKKVIEVIPKDKKVKYSINLKKPVYTLYPESTSGKGFKRLAYSIVGKEEQPRAKSGFFEKIFSLFKKY